MQAQPRLSDSAIEGIAERILMAQQIRRIDQQRFMHAMLSKSFLSSRDQRLIRQIFDGVQRGVLRVVD